MRKTGQPRDCHGYSWWRRMGLGRLAPCANSNNWRRCEIEARPRVLVFHCVGKAGSLGPVDDETRFGMVRARMEREIRVLVSGSRDVFFAVMASKLCLGNVLRELYFVPWYTTRLIRRAHHPRNKRRVKEEIDGKHTEESSQYHVECNSPASLSRDYAVGCQ